MVLKRGGVETSPDLRLNQFFRAVPRWPRNETELASAADKVRTALDVPFSWLGIPQLGYRGAGDRVLSEALRDRIERLGATSASPAQSQQLQVRHVHLSAEGLGLSDAVTHLAVVPLSAEFRGKRRDLGWLGVGSARALPARGEVLLLAIAQRLIDLCLISSSEQEIAMRDQFLSIASHELKTPLTSIYGLLQLQERMLRPRAGVPSAGSPDPEKQLQLFKILIRQTERLNELIDGLLDVSRIQNGRFLVEPSEADAGEIVHETVSNRLAVIARDAGVSLQLEAPEHLAAWIDPVRFEEVVTNLGMNSIRFSPEGGVVWVRLRGDSGHGLVLSLRDQGPALPEADRMRIFEPFEYAHRTTRLGGLGLGLFISRQIAQLHGGDVELVESIPGKGNLFEATFPTRAESRISA